MILTKLQQLRKDNQLTCQQMADQTGLSKEYYWMLENGKRNLSYPNAVKIARVFKKEPDDIFLSSELTKTEQGGVK